MPFANSRVNQTYSQKIKIKMLEVYYRIWVSLFIHARQAQNGDKNYALFLSVCGISITNFVNISLIIIILSLSGIKIGLLEILPENRMLRNIAILAIFILPNYFLFVHNQNYKALLEKYESRNNKNSGIKYFLYSSLLFLLLIISTMIFPTFFNLTVSK